MKQRVTAGLVASYCVLIALAAMYLYPFLIAVVGSFKDDAQATKDPMSLIPSPFTTAAYERLFTGTGLPLWAMNSLMIAMVVTASRVFFDSLAGYALSRLRFRGRSLVFSLFIAVMAVPSVVLMVPRFLVIKELGMFDTYFGMILPLLIDVAGIFI